MVEAHEQIRLETLSGETIAYFAPNAEVTRSFDDDLNVSGLPDPASPPLVLDFSTWTIEVTVQGHFETTATGGLPEAHVNDLETLFGKSPVTAQDQFNRLIDMVVFGESGPYALYNEGDEYTATVAEDVNVAEGVYPAVSIEQIQPGLNSGETRESYTVKFRPGVEQ